MKPKKLTEDQIQSTLTRAIEDAVAFVSDEIAPERIAAQQYYDGKTKIGTVEGRSKVVATKCRDTIRAIKPGLMRVFLQSGQPVEFVPRKPQDELAMEQATKYASYIFERNGGFKLLHSAVHDPLVKKVGILKAYWDETPDYEVDEYSGVDPQIAELIKQDPEVTVLSEEMAEDGLRLRVAKESNRGEIKIMPVAPEDFFVDRSATSIEDCYVCGHTAEVRVGDVVAMGFDFEEVYELSGRSDSGSSDEEEQVRTGWSEEDDEAGIDPSMRPVKLTEAYMKMDIEGLGVPKLYKFLCASDKYTILDYELADVNPFAVYEIDPEPHTFFGKSLVEIIQNDQDASTALLRGLLDNIAMMNHPAREVVDGQVNMDDVLNTEIGAIIRTKQPGMVRELTFGNAATAALPAIDYYDNVIRAKTGIIGAGMGLEPDALQNQTATGVRMMDQAVSAVSEFIARCLAETGHKRLFKIIAQLARQHPDQNAMMRINGQFTAVDPRSWSADMDMTVSVGLGTNKAEEKAIVLRETLQSQMMVMQQFGPFNPIAGMDKALNTMADILRLAGLNNTGRYFTQLTPEQMMQMAQQMAQGQPQGDPMAGQAQALIQAEQVKASATAQSAMIKAQVDMQKAAMEDDRKRDEMLQNLYLQGAKIAADTGVKINANQVRQQQAATQPGMMNDQGQV